MNLPQRIQFETLMEPVCARPAGRSENPRLSRPPRDVRFGSHGSMSANFETGEFYDHENKTGGGVIDLIRSTDSNAIGVPLSRGSVTRD